MFRNVSKIAHFNVRHWNKTVLRGVSSIPNNKCNYLVIKEFIKLLYFY